MDVQSLLQAVSTVGFPIVMCGVLMYYMNLERESHKEEMTSMRDSLDRNTNIMTELKEMIKLLTGYGGKEE